MGREEFFKDYFSTTTSQYASYTVMIKIVKIDKYIIFQETKPVNLESGFGVPKKTKKNKVKRKENRSLILIQSPHKGSK